MPALGPGSRVALAPHQADFFVTEYGVAPVRDLSTLERAQALISVAAPQFRDALAKLGATLPAASKSNWSREWSAITATRFVLRRGKYWRHSALNMDASPSTTRVPFPS